MNEGQRYLVDEEQHQDEDENRGDPDRSEAESERDEQTDDVRCRNAALTSDPYPIRLHTRCNHNHKPVKTFLLQTNG